MTKELTARIFTLAKECSRLYEPGTLPAGFLSLLARMVAPHRTL